MGETDVDGTQRSTLRWASITEAQRAWLKKNRVNAEHVLDLPHLVGWQTGHVLTSVNLYAREGGWTIQVKIDRARGPYVAYTDAATFHGAFVRFIANLFRGRLDWRWDKWAPKGSRFYVSRNS